MSAKNHFVSPGDEMIFTANSHGQENNTQDAE